MRRACLCTFLFIATALCWLAFRPAGNPGRRIPVALVGYTNNPGADIPTAIAAGVAKTNFALFRIQNPTARDFFCYIGPVLVGTNVIAFQNSQSGDFDLPPGASSTFAVPVPAFTQPWRCVVVLCHKRNYPQWKRVLVNLAERCGFDSSERSWFAVSPEIAR